MSIKMGNDSLTAEETTRLIDASLYEQVTSVLAPSEITGQNRAAVVSLLQSCETLDDCVAHGAMPADSAQRERMKFIEEFRAKYAGKT